MKKEAVLILDFGAQYSQLIARRVRDLNVYCEIKPYRFTADQIKEAGYKGIILTGGPNSVYGEKALKCDPTVFSLGIPVLGICYGAQLMAYTLGGKVASADVREYGKTPVHFRKSVLFDGLEETFCWMSHTDYIAEVPEGFHVSAVSDDCPTAAMECPEKQLYAFQFHPEVEHTVHGSEMLRHFLYDVCGCSGDWRMDTFAADTIRSIRERVGSKKVLCALSGGVDSSVAAVLMHKASGKNLVCIFVDHGLLRKNEGDDVERVFRHQFDMNLIRVNAKDRFLQRLAGVSDPERKRKIIGEEFIRVFEEESSKLGRLNSCARAPFTPTSWRAARGGCRHQEPSQRGRPAEGHWFRGYH